MEFKLKNLMLTAIAVAASSVFAHGAIPGYGQDTQQTWTAKYFYAPINSTTPDVDWYTAGFDDSGWETIEGPISTANDLGYYATEWPQNYTAYWLRSHFEVTDPTVFAGALLKVIHDDGCIVYLNGEKVYQNDNVIIEPYECNVSAGLFKKGDNLLAVYVADTGGGDAYIDFGLTTYTELAIDIPQPGAMGDSILAHVANFSDVYALKLRGKVNSTDMETLGRRLVNLRSLDMEDVDLKEIGESSFRDNSKLSKIVFPGNLEKIGNDAFYSCFSLSEAAIPSGVKEIGDYAFNNTALREIMLPEGLITLGSGAFCYCMQNRCVSLPSTLITVPEYAFEQNVNLNRISFSEGLETIGYRAFYQSKEITELSFPSSLKTISSGAFEYAGKLGKIEFNEGLYQIGDNAFYNCDSLREVTLPSTLVRADASPFDYCDNLRKVTCLSVEPPYMTDQIPYGLNMAGRELCVPAISLNIYKQTTGWDKFPIVTPIDYLPDNITITRDEVLTLQENLPAGYKPDLSVGHIFDSNYRVYTYGHLEINGDATVSLNNLSMVMDQYFQWYNNGIYNPYSSLVNNVQMTAESVHVTMYPRSNEWVFISLPFDVRVEDIKSCMDGTTSFVIRRYSGFNRAEGESGSTWQTVGNGDILKTGEGYILQAVRYIDNSRQGNVGLVFTAVDNENKNNLFMTTDAKVALNEYPAELIQNRGWNLVGNPYPCYYDSRFMDFEAPVTVWDISYNTYRVYSPLDDSYIFTPGEAFFVQCPGGGLDIRFDKDGRQLTRDVRELSSPSRSAVQGATRTVVNLSLCGESGTDATRVVLNDLAARAYEPSRDAAKFFSPEAAVPQLYTIEGDVEHAINERPLSNGEVALGIIIGVPGSYTIKLDSDIHGYKVMLDDLTEGESVRLDGTDGYTFIADKGKVGDRFRISFMGNDINFIDAVESDSDTDDATGIYTIDGKAVNYPVPGAFYIKNGKKVYVK